MKTKIISVFLVLAVLCTAICGLVGCGGKKEEAGGDPFADLKRMQALHKQAKEKKNT